MRTLIFQHTPEDHLGSLRTWLQQSRFPFDTHHFYEKKPIPAPVAYEWLVILGGPMNIDEEEKYPWLVREKAYLREWLEGGKPVLGICLGGQMLAQALGGTVVKNAQREIGFHSVTRTGADHSALRRWPMTLPVFHWHEDAFSLPPHCESLLTSEACRHQAFARDHRTVGLQFHPEAVEDWIHGNFQKLQPQPGERFVQTKAQAQGIMPQLLPPMTQKFFHFLEDFVEGARPR